MAPGCATAPPPDAGGSSAFRVVNRNASKPVTIGVEGPEGSEVARCERVPCELDLPPGRYVAEVKGDGATPDARKQFFITSADSNRFVVRPGSTDEQWGGAFLTGLGAVLGVVGLGAVASPCADHDDCTGARRFGGVVGIGGVAMIMAGIVLLGDGSTRFDPDRSASRPTLRPGVFVF